MQTGVTNMDSGGQEDKYPNTGSQNSCQNESLWVRNEPCPSCGSKDNLGRYDDGHGVCFGIDCNHYEHPTGGSVVRADAPKNTKGNKTGDYIPIRGRATDLEKRKISEQTCRKFGYSIGEYNGERCHIASFVQSGKTVGQKIRLKNKDFRTLGDCSGLWGKHLWSTGKKIVITEGEIDALSVAEAQNCKWPTVSIPNGVGSSIKAVSKDLEWLLDNFEEIILMYDMDSQGQEAVKRTAELFPPGRCKVATTSEKDANATLLKHGGSALVSAIWQARVYRPDGIIAGEDTWDLVNADVSDSEHLYPWRGLNEKTLGARRGEIVTFCAGTGAGKSTAVKEIASYFLSKGETLGYIALEESVRQAAIDFMSITANKMLHLEKDLDEKYRRELWESVFADNRLYLYDHWGSVDVEILSNRIRYLVRSCGVGWIVLDHLSIMVSGIEGGDERRLIDNIMTTLRQLCEELNIGMFIVSHLKRPQQGKGHEDGKQVTLSDLRGSGSIAQLSDFVIGLERDQQSDGETNVRVLKARYKGSSTGLAGSLFYDTETGRLRECGSVQSGGESTKEIF
jgi:twinkle protein